MKKALFIVLMVFVLVVCLSSCKDDIDSVLSVLGEWEYSEGSSQIVLEFKANNAVIMTTYINGKEMLAFGYTFTATSKTGGFIDTGESTAEYTISGDELTYNGYVFTRQ